MSKKLTILSSIALVALLLAVSLETFHHGIVDAAPPQNARDFAAPNSDTAPISPAAGQSVTPAAPDRGLAVVPDRLTVGQNPGAYYLDYGSTVLDPSIYPVKGSMRYFGWSALQFGPNNYNWSGLDSWISQRSAIGLSTGVALTTFDGIYDGDIRSTPDFVIATPGTMVITPDYVDYYAGRNGDFESSSHTSFWELTGNAAVVQVPGDNWAGRMGGKDNANDSITKSALYVPTMPPELTSGTKMELSFSVYMTTTDTLTDTDHLYVELVDGNTPPNVIYQAYHATNTSGPKGTWLNVGPLDVSGFVGRTLRLRARATTNATNPTNFYLDNVVLRVRLIIPKYWGTPYQNLYRTFVQALGDKLRNDSRVDFVAIGTGRYGETVPADWEQNPTLEQAGLTADGWIKTVNTITDMYVAAFSSGTTLRKNLLLQYAPYFKTAYERRDFANHAAGLGVGLSYNGLNPDWTSAFTNDGWGDYDPLVPEYNSVPIAWESYTYMLCTPVYTYWALFSGLDKHGDYMRIGDDLLTGSDGTVNRGMFQWARNYWGKTPQNTPSVWVVMREHRNPTPYCHTSAMPNYAYVGSYPTWPQLGNYNFWLYQDDRIAGGKTVPETNDPGADSRYARNPVNGAAWVDAGLGNCPTSNTYASFYGPNYPCFPRPYNENLPKLVGSNPANYYDPNPLTGEGKEAWVIRRTDQDTDNPFMWFTIDSQYIDGSINPDVYTVDITVKYLDMGNDTWTLKYDSISGEKIAGTVTKTGTKLLKTQVFHITDGKFAKRLTGGADFVIDSRALDGTKDGNEWIHMVDVAKVSAQPATPTATPTSTRTPTPSVTPTSTPTTGVVEGIAFYDRNGNGLPDAGEGLSGAVLVLKQNMTEKYTATSQDGGLFRFEAVSPAQYTLAEKTPPPGYYLSIYSIGFMVGANQTLQFDVPHQAMATATPTATATVTSTTDPKHHYLPLLWQKNDGS
jgi:hypothetical protein